MDDLSNHEKAAQSQPRDENGHFAPKLPIDNQNSQNNNPLYQYVNKNIHYDKKHDDLLDIHVGNPLARITQLLQDIKKQKAFSFTLKGSLGIMGVGLVLSTFGIFGGAKLLCDKGRQTHVGVVRVLGTPDQIDYRWPLIEPVVEYYRNFMNPGRINSHHPRAILHIGGSETLYVPYVKEADLLMYNGQKVFITGEYDSCSRTLQVGNIGDVEAFE
jgi:hypothetical protein